MNETDRTSHRSEAITDRISITRPCGERASANDSRFARIGSVTVLPMHMPLLYFCCMCHLACYSWLNFRVPALIDTAEASGLSSAIARVATDRERQLSVDGG